MFMRSRALILLSNRLNYTTKKGLHIYFYRSFLGFHCRCLTSDVDKPYSTSIKDNDGSTKKTKPNNLELFENNQEQKLISSVKYLSKVMSYGEKFIKIMRCEGDFDLNGVINTLQNYDHFKEKYIRPLKYKDEIKSSSEFERFLEGLEKNILKLEVHHLVSALSCIHWFGLPADKDLYTSIMLRMLEKTDDLKLDDAVLLTAIIQRINKDHDENVLMTELREELKSKIQNNVTKKINHLTELEMISVLKFLRSYDYEWPDQAVIKLLNSCFHSTTIWSHPSAFASVYGTASFLKDEYQKKEFQFKVLLKLFDYSLKENIHKAIISFAQEYAIVVRSGRDVFDEKMYNSIMDSVMRRKLTLKNLHNIISTTVSTRYIRIDVLEMIKKCVFSDMIYNNIHPYFATRNDYFIFYRNCLDIIVCSEFQMSQRDWNRLKSYLNVHPILTNVNEWENANLITSLRLALSLAAMDIYPNKVLEYLFQNIHLEEDGQSSKNHMLICLNQASALLNINNPKSFLKEVPPSFTIDLENENLEIFTSDIKNTLDRLKISYLTNVLSKLGHNIGFVVAVNDKNEFFRFKISNEKLYYIEEVSVPNGYKLVLVLPILDFDYCRNWYTLRSSTSVIVKSLEKMKYETVPILYDKWGDLSSEGKKNFLFQKFNRREL